MNKRNEGLSSPQSTIIVNAERFIFSAIQAYELDGLDLINSTL